MAFGGRKTDDRYRRASSGFSAKNVMVVKSAARSQVILRPRRKERDPIVMLDRYRSQASLAISLILAVIWMGAISYGVLKIVC
jgi:hypothetical protein